MEGKDVTRPRREFPASLSRLSIRGAALALVAGLLAFEWRGAKAAAGAAAGGLAAAFYAMSFLRSHLSRAQRDSGLEPKLSIEKAFDKKLLLHAGVRMAAVAVLAAAALLLGRSSLVGFLSTFALGLAVLLTLELPRAMRQLRTVLKNPIPGDPMKGSGDRASGRQESA
jgi:hypothetical protein